MLPVLNILEKTFSFCTTMGIQVKCHFICGKCTASLEPLAHCRNVASISLFYGYYFGRCLSDLAELVPLWHFCGSSTPNSNRSHDFSFTICRYCYDIYVNSFFPYAARLGNSFSVECFSLTYNVSDFKFTILDKLFDQNRKIQ